MVARDDRKRPKKTPDFAKITENNAKNRYPSSIGPNKNRMTTKRHDSVDKQDPQTEPDLTASSTSCGEKCNKTSEPPNFGVHPAPQRSTRAPRQRGTTFLHRQWPRHGVSEIFTLSGKHFRWRHDPRRAFAARENALRGSSVRGLAFQARCGRLELPHFSPRGLVGAVGGRTPRAMGECSWPVSSRSFAAVQSPITNLFQSLF